MLYVMNFMKYHKHVLVVFLLVIVFVSLSTPIQAYSFFSKETVANDCFECGACSLCDLLLIASKGVRFLLSLCGAVALALFVYGGFELLMSQGKAEAVEKGKKMITGTVVGLFIVLLAAWVWPNWIIISLKGIPTEGKPATIFSNDAWWITPCRAYKATEACVKRQPASGLTGTQDDTCILLKEGLLTGEWKKSGMPCATCPKPPCVCVNKDRACINGCVTSKDCDPNNLNFCDKNFQPDATGERGICVKVTPGAVCQNDSDCPSYSYEDLIPVGTGSITKTREVELYCEKTKGQCYIKENEPCEAFYRQYCALPHTICKFDAIGVVYECKRTTNRTCTVSDTSKCTQDEQCLVNYNAQVILCPAPPHAAAGGCTCRPKFY